MESMVSTLEVSKWDTSRVVKPSQAENMLFIFVTLEVSKRDTSKVVSASQFLNMPLMSVTPEVLRCSSPSMVVRAEQPENM